MNACSTRAFGAAVAGASLVLLARASLAQPAPAAQAAPAPSLPDTLDPATPLADLPEFGVDWPTMSAPAADGAAAASPSTPTGDRSADLARYRVVLTGAEELGGGFRAQFDALSSLVQGESQPANAAQIDRRAREDETLVRTLLAAEGRYDGDVSTSVAAQAAQPVVTIAIQPGPAYSFDKVAISGLTGAAAPLRDAIAIRDGDPVNAERVNAAVEAFRAKLGQSGYPFAKVADPDIVIDHATQHASLTLAIALGESARFGRIVEAGDRAPFGVRHMADIARFKSGQPYDAALVEDFRRALVATGLVSTTTVTPIPSADPAVVDIRVEAGRAPPRTVAGEFGYSTGQGARAEVSWQHRNLLPPEGAVTFRGVAGTREQALSASLRRSNFHARDRVLTAQVSAAHTDLDAYDARTISGSIGLERQSNIIWQKVWTWSLGAELLATNERDTIEATGQPRRRTFIVAALPSSLMYDASDDLLNPTRGFRLGGRISPEASLHKRFDGYVRLQGDASVYLPLSERFTLAGRVRVAAIQGAKRDNIAPSRRLYAGGGGSVRGFGYQKIGPVDVNGDPIGGRGLTEFGTELRARFGAFGVVPFLDAGQLYAQPYPKITHLRYGAGLGARYYSSFGPIRIDVGTPLDRRRGESRVAVYVSLGQAF